MFFNWTYERAGDWVFRVSAAGAFADTGPTYLAEAKKCEFIQSGTCIGEPIDHDCWFEYGPTAEEALLKLKRELWS